jgi:hypothetical protein
MSRFIEGLPSKFLDTQLFFAPDDLSLLNHTKKYRLPTTYCDFCKAVTKNYIRLESDSELAEEFARTSDGLIRSEVKYKIGGLRSKTESETKEILEAQLNKLGAKAIIAPNTGNPFSKSGFVSCYSAHIEQSGNNESPYLYRRSVGAGKGITPTQAYFSMAFELIEHIGLQYTGDIPLYCAKYKDVKNIAIDMPRLADTIMNRHTAYDDFDEDREVDWVVATSLTGGGKKLVPAFLAFMNDVELKGNLFTSTSSGAAAGLTMEDAILHGLFEAIERDAWLIGQCNPYVLPLVDYSNVTNEKIKEFVNKANEMGYDVITRDYTNDVTIPVFRTWIVNRNNFSTYAYTGFGCHVSPEIAIERSLTEAAQTNDKSDYGGDIDAGMITPYVMTTSMVNLNNQHHLVKKTY